MLTSLCSYKVPKDDFRFSGSPLWLLGSVYGPKSVLESAQKLTLLLLRPETGLNTIERSYPDKLVARTFVGMDAIDWLQRRFPEYGNDKAELVQAMENLLQQGFIEPLGSTVTDYVLGGLYNFTNEAEKLSQGDAPEEGRLTLKRSINGVASNSTPAAVQDFLAHFQALIWFTYRQDCPAIEPTALTSDTGWGCMLRTGQMMLANALCRMLLGRDFRLLDATENQLETHGAILKLFADLPGPEFPYSIHNIAHVGTLFKRNVGEWFGPTIIANVLKVLVRKFSHAGLTCYLAQDRVIYKENVNILCRSTPPHTVLSPRLPGGGLLGQNHQLSNGEWRPVLILSCVRLGMETFNPIYTDTLADLFKIPQMLGIIGGKPNASLFFVGMQDDYIIYLDPHYLQPTVDVNIPGFDSSSFHNAHPQKMPAKDVDPCLALAFFCATANDFEELCTALQVMAHENPDRHIVGVGEKDPKHGGTKTNEKDPLEHLEF